MTTDHASFKPLSKLLVQFEVEQGIVCDIKACTRAATRILVVHQMDHCNETTSGYVIGKPVGTGARVYFMCEPDALNIQGKVHEQIAVMNRKARLRDPHGKVHCKACGLVARTGDDVTTMNDLIPDEVWKNA